MVLDVPIFKHIRVGHNLFFFLEKLIKSYTYIFLFL